ncbi:P-loop NTPase fold protein (plasmid) [Rhizobium sp. CB3171]|uniref:KAP family P-loop NTPase fold protein n=1 Tax=Rhizobium sp. CB3171 TaxID=3039157 RepID=UPI0024B167FB|nr:P-loop NTPase fold protein [Rhizobium sp. CB3171]WFU04545.1 P-loop NTPase fold protein [Rhizobium sp. CB3171]
MIFGSFRNWFTRTAARLPFSADFDIGSDVPIRTASQDLLRRSKFAERIADILSQLNLDEGRVFAIRGAWGTGKSSLKNLVIEQLAARESGARWMDFNPWQWGDGDAISKALFKQIADELGGPLSSEAGRRASIFRKYGAILTGSGPSIKKIGADQTSISLFLANASVIAVATSLGLKLPSVAKIAGALATASIVVPIVGHVIAYFGKDRWSEPLDKIRIALEKSLRGLDRPLVIFVDDIDRLEPDQIRVLIRQIKVNANLPNIVFVLLFQPSIVESALDPIANSQGRDFLKKIVQANFDLPALSKSSVHEIVTTDLSRIASPHATPKNGFEQVRWGNALLGTILPFVENLRDARRFLSSVAIHLPLHVGKNELEVNVIDFLALDAIQVFEPDLYAALFNQQELLLQSGRFRGDREDDAHRTQLIELVNRASEANRSTIEAAFKLLFPKTEWAFGGRHLGDAWHKSWSDAKRVCSERFFARYFELQLGADEISENEFVDILSASTDAELLQNALASVEQRGLSVSLAGRLDDGVEKLPVENAGVLLPAMFAFAQKFVAEREDPFSSPWVRAWRAISWYIDRIPPETRGAETLNALRMTGALSVASVIIHLNDPADQEEGSRIDPKLDENTVRLMKEEWLRQIVEKSTDIAAFLDEPDLASLLYRWRDYTGSVDAPKSWVASAIETDEGFAQLVARLMSIGTVHSAGDLVSSRVEQFDIKMLESFISVDEIRRRLPLDDRERLTLEQQHALEVLKRSIESGERGRTQAL